MKNTLLFALLITSGILVAQTKTNVNVANGGFTPANITINVGDTVEFVNTSGVHWVDGRQTTFASNPASFDNQSQSGTGWTYQQVFTVAGNYDYRCGIHTTTMFGSITVQTPSNINEVGLGDNSIFYPNPATNQLFFKSSDKINEVVIYTLTGAEVLNVANINNQIDVSTLKSGVYFVKTTTKEGKINTQKMIIQ